MTRRARRPQYCEALEKTRKTASSCNQNHQTLGAIFAHCRLHRDIGMLLTIRTNSHGEKSCFWNDKKMFANVIWVVGKCTVQQLIGAMTKNCKTTTFYEFSKTCQIVIVSREAKQTLLYFHEFSKKKPCYNRLLFSCRKLYPCHQPLDWSVPVNIIRRSLWILATLCCQRTQHSSWNCDLDSSSTFQHVNDRFQLDTQRKKSKRSKWFWLIFRLGPMLNFMRKTPS